jgi:4,5-dihydroxyphthalate decarboxylase
MPDKMKLFTMIGEYPNTTALRSGAIKSDLVDYDFDDVKVPNTAFKPLVREAKYDCAELAINTFLQAKYYDKPYVLLPATIVGRGQIHNLLYNSERGVVRPTELHGKRVGVRAYTQTTGMWVRGMLAALYGMDVEQVNWVTFEDGHIAEYKDPPFVSRAAPGKQLTQMLLDGELDAAIITDRSDPRLKPVVPDHEEVSRKWAETHGGVPINHMLVMRKSIVQSRPDVARDVFRTVLESRRAMDSGKEGKLDPLRFGLDNVRKALELAIEMSLVQKFIFRKLSVDELFDDTTRALAG